MAETHVGAQPNGNVSRLTFRLTMVVGLMVTIGAGGFAIGVFSRDAAHTRGDVSENTVGRRAMQTEVNQLIRRAAAHEENHSAVERRFDAIDSALRRIDAKLSNAGRPR
jgi:hypothetical protein